MDLVKYVAAAPKQFCVNMKQLKNVVIHSCQDCTKSDILILFVSTPKYFRKFQYAKDCIPVEKYIPKPIGILSTGFYSLALRIRRLDINLIQNIRSLLQRCGTYFFIVCRILVFVNGQKLHCYVNLYTKFVSIF